ncbi:hypothetical protein, partial [Bacillus cereus group sp. BfR-BA-01315]|uniref:hypothetical protein n=1 Tax=Bacillus cereus group sp. BfR-BA-01315 TaxID=2920292 RepID=UPI001F58C3E3
MSVKIHKNPEAWTFFKCPRFGVQFNQSFLGFLILLYYQASTFFVSPFFQIFPGQKAKRPKT